ncbi:MAG: hypothetical protein GY895_07820 [Phycisphaera sp.]|nr:hypothetical protein [Phycisphaera sp.]
MQAATILAAGGLVLGLFFIGQPASTPFIVGMVLAVALPFIVLVGAFLWSQFLRRTHQGSPSSESISTVLPRWSPEADEEVVKTITSWFKFDPRPHPEVIAVCHPSITEIVGLQGPPHLLEPEPLIEGDVKILSGRLLLAAISIIGMVVLIVAIEGGFTGPALIQMAPMLGFPAIPVGMMVLRRIRSRGGPRFIMGTGFVRETTGDRIISVDDAVLYARPSRVMAHGAAYFMDVDLIGSDLRLRFQFRDPRCREFRALWDRWCHPNPRPELASVAIG